MKFPINIYSIWLFFGLFTHIFLSLTAQTPQPYPLEVPDNFSVKTIYEFHEDEVTGDMWIGTEEGLYKYDGVDFQHYIAKDYSSDISGLQQDSTGRIWCQNFSGQFFYVEGDSLKTFISYTNYQNFFPTYTIDYFPTIYLTGSYGYLEIDFYSKKETVRHFEIDSTNYKINDKNDTLYQEQFINIKSHQDELFLLKNLTLCHTTFPPQQNSFSCSQPALNRVHRANFVSSNEKLLIIFPDTQPTIIEWTSDTVYNKIALSPLLQNMISSSFLQDDDFFWIGLGDGLVILDQEYKPVYGNQKILKGKTVSDVVKDQIGNYWLATLNDGIHLLPSKDILVLNKENSPLEEDEIMTVVGDGKEHLYLLQKMGKVWELDINTHEMSFLCDFGVRSKRLFYDAFHQKLYTQYSNQVYNLKKHEMNLFFKRSGFKSMTFIDEENLLYSQGVYIINRIPKKRHLPMDSIWRNSKFAKKQSNGYIQLKFRQKRSAYHCYDAVDQRFWIAYTDGLYTYKDAVEQEVFYQNKSILISSLIPASEGGVWLSTIDKELLYIRDTTVVKNISIGETILGIKQWKNTLFLATNKGVFKYGLDQDSIEIFNSLDGLPSDNITGLEVLNDTLYIATNKGLAFIPVNYSSINATPPSISISNVAIWEKDTTLQKHYLLEANQNNLKISFKGRSIRSQGQMQYKYRMIGLDSTWVKVTDNQNIVRYPSLPSGNYTFEVKTINEDKVESTQSAKIQFYIDSPYYLKWWFILSVIGFIAAIISSFFLVRISAMKKSNELLASQQELKTKLIQSQLTALRSQMNPHFMFNALNSIQEYTLTNQKELASDYLGKFSDLMRLYLNHSRAQTISLQEELEALNLYLELEEMRFEDSLKYELEVADSMLIEDISLPPMLIQPYVENAIKHGLFHKKSNRKLSISFGLNEHHALYCTIYDNGIGRQQSAIINQIRKNKPNSFATSAIQNRIALLNQNRIKPIQVTTIDLLDELQKPCGTQVEITIP